LLTPAAGAESVDLGKWIRQRLKEAKAAGLVRLTKPPAASHTLKASAAAQAAGMVSPSPHVITTAFGSSYTHTYNLSRYTRGSSDLSRVNDTAGGAAKGRPAGSGKRRGSGENDVAAPAAPRPGGVPGYVPLVFKPPPPQQPGDVGAASRKSPTKSRVPDPKQQHPPSPPPPPPPPLPLPGAEAARQRGAAASAAAAGRDPTLPWFAQRPSTYATPGTAGQPLVLGALPAVAWDNNILGSGGGEGGGSNSVGTGTMTGMGASGILKPGPNPAAESLGCAPGLLVAAAAASAGGAGAGARGVDGDGDAHAARGGQQATHVPAGLPKTVQGVGDRVRRLTQAVALAQKDMATRGLRDAGGGSGGVGGGGGVGACEPRNQTPT
jgi:hypothetical protein